MLTLVEVARLQLGLHKRGIPHSMTEAVEIEYLTHPLVLAVRSLATLP